MNEFEWGAPSSPEEIRRIAADGAFSTNNSHFSFHLRRISELAIFKKARLPSILSDQVRRGHIQHITSTYTIVVYIAGSLNPASKWGYKYVIEPALRRTFALTAYGDEASATKRADLGGRARSKYIPILLYTHRYMDNLLRQTFLKNVQNICWLSVKCVWILFSEKTRSNRKVAVQWFRVRFSNSRC